MIDENEDVEKAFIGLKMALFEALKDNNDIVYTNRVARVEMIRPYKEVTEEYLKSCIEACNGNIVLAGRLTGASRNKLHNIAENRNLRYNRRSTDQKE